MGSVIVNTGLAIGAFLVTFGLVVLLTWPDVAWEWATWTTIAVTLFVPLFLYPWAQTLWMGYDLYVHPLEIEEQRAAAARVEASAL